MSKTLVAVKPKLIVKRSLLAGMMLAISGVAVGVLAFNGVLPSFFAASTTVTQSEAAPWLYLTHGDVIGDKQNGFAGLGYDGKVLLGTSVGKIFRYQNGAIQQVGDGGSTSSINSLFITSQGTLLASWPTGVWYSTDNGDHWVKSLTYSQTDGRSMSYTEDDQGNLYTGQYSLVATGAAQLYKSADGGVTWSNISPTAFSTARHIHYVYWDQYRNKLFVAIGDAGQNNVFVSDDHGATFSVWGSAEQTVAIVSDQQYIYGVRDTAGSRFIWRATDDGIQTNVHDIPQDSVGWWGHRDADGNIIFAISRESNPQSMIIASSDHGDSWTTYVDKPGKYLDRFALPSSYYTNWDGFYYGGGNFLTAKWRLYPANADFKISADGVDYVADGITRPWKTIAAFNAQPLQQSSSVSLLSSFSSNEPLIISTSQTTVDGAGHTLAYAPQAPIFSSDFESGNPFTSLTQTNGTAQVVTGQVAHSGQASFVVRTTAPAAVAYGNQLVGPFNSGDTMWASGWVYVNSDIATGQFFDLMRFWSSTGNGSIIVKLLDSKTLSMRLENVGRTYSVLQSAEPAVQFPARQWVKLKLKVTVSDTTGTITLWQDDKMILHSVGLDTLITNKPWNYGRWGVYTQQFPVEIYWDDVAVSRTDPDSQQAMVIAGNDVIAKNFIATNGIKITGNNAQIQQNSFVGNGTVLAVAASSQGATLEHNTVYGGQLGLDNSGSGTIVSNNIFGGQTSLSAQSTGNNLDDDHNLFEVGVTGFTPASSDITAAPQFSDAS
ncbi:MAG: hypothetical protein PHW95_01645, partial [Patescibacteria group bacterium]|nr:hypothetical protein [Patescibacteria group bacterium]